MIASDVHNINHVTKSFVFFSLAQSSGSYNCCANLVMLNLYISGDVKEVQLEGYLLRLRHFKIKQKTKKCWILECFAMLTYVSYTPQLLKSRKTTYIEKQKEWTHVNWSWPDIPGPILHESKFYRAPVNLNHGNVPSLQGELGHVKPYRM